MFPSELCIVFNGRRLPGLAPIGCRTSEIQVIWEDVSAGVGSAVVSCRPSDHG
jgi:hypothetical protein